MREAYTPKTRLNHYPPHDTELPTNPSVASLELGGGRERMLRAVAAAGEKGHRISRVKKGKSAHIPYNWRKLHELGYVHFREFSSEVVVNEFAELYDEEWTSVIDDTANQAGNMELVISDKGRQAIIARDTAALRDTESRSLIDARRLQKQPGNASLMKFSEGTYEHMLWPVSSPALGQDFAHLFHRKLVADITLAPGGRKVTFTLNEAGQAAWDALFGAMDAG